MIPTITRPEEIDLIEEKPSKAPFTKDVLMESLKKYICSVTFTKLDGTVRVMRCTLLESYFPKKDISNLVREQTNNEAENNLLAVWDLDKTGWRSFKVDSVTKATVENIDG